MALKGWKNYMKKINKDLYYYTCLIGFLTFHLEDNYELIEQFDTLYAEEWDKESEDDQ